MEGQRWNIPEDGVEKEAAVAEIADDLCARYDRITYEIMNRALQQVQNEMGLRD